jgi:hypothetical protein
MGILWQAWKQMRPLQMRKQIQTGAAANRSFKRLTNAFSKQFEKHVHALAL